MYVSEPRAAMALLQRYGPSRQISPDSRDQPLKGNEGLNKIMQRSFNQGSFALEIPP